MTSISIFFLIWSDSILNKFWINWNPYLKLQCTNQNSKMTQYELPTPLRHRWLWCSPEHFPVKGESVLAGWGMVRKKNFISCFGISFQPLLDPVVSHLLFILPYLVFCWSPCLACHSSRQASFMSLLHHEAFCSWHASSWQLQPDYCMRWDAEWRCFGHSRGQYESDLWAAGPCRAWFLRTLHWVILSPSRSWL